MGIHILSKVIKAHAPSAVTEIGINKLEGKIIAIDASQTIYQYVLAIRGSGDDLKDSKGNITSHLQAMLYKSLTLIRLGCKIVYIFDGKPNKLKNKLLEKRKKERVEAKSKIKDSKDSKDSKDKKENMKNYLKSFFITEEMVSECKHLLDLLGIPYIHAPEEADPQCAYLARKKLVDYVQSDDMDLLPFGTPNLIKTVRKSSKTITKYNLSKILEEVDVTMDQFIDICILLGSDYCDTIYGLGEKKIVSFVKKYEDIEGILKWITKSDPKSISASSEFKSEYKETRKYFQKPKVIHKDDIKLKWSQPDVMKVLEYLESKKFNKNILGNRLIEYWKFWCNFYCDPKDKKKMLKKQLFPGIYFGASHDLSFISSDDDDDDSESD